MSFFVPECSKFQNLRSTLSGTKERATIFAAHIIRSNHDLTIAGVNGGFQSGLSYQRLEEECWQSEPNLVTEMPGSGFVREKKVELEGDDEHVLYVQ